MGETEKKGQKGHKNKKMRKDNRMGVLVYKASLP